MNLRLIIGLSTIGYVRAASNSKDLLKQEDYDIFQDILDCSSLEDCQPPACTNKSDQACNCADFKAFETCVKRDADLCTAELYNQLFAKYRKVTAKLCDQPGAGSRRSTVSLLPKLLFLASLLLV